MRAASPAGSATPRGLGPEGSPRRGALLQLMAREPEGPAELEVVSGGGLAVAGCRPGQVAAAVEMAGPRARSPTAPRQRRALARERGSGRDHGVEVRHLPLQQPRGPDRIALDQERAPRRRRPPSPRAPPPRRRRGSPRRSSPRGAAPSRRRGATPRRRATRGVARDPEGPHPRRVQIGAPVTQEQHLVRSAGRPVEDVEAEERGTLARERFEKGDRLLPRRRPHVHVGDHRRARACSDPTRSTTPRRAGRTASGTAR